jgi:hypothetical protein
MKKEQREQQKENMFSLIEKWQQSDQTQKDFCREHDLKLATFHYWQKRFRKQDKEEPSGFIPMEISSSYARAVEIRYPNGVIIQLPVLDLKLLRQLVHL